MRTLLIEPEDQEADSIVSALRHQGYTVDRVCDDGEARLAFSTIRYGLVLLNVGLPDASGHSLLVWLRRLNGNVPLMTFGRDETAADRVNVLDAGADDHLSKPFDMREMSARCRALIRRSQGRTVEQVQYRELFVDPPAKVVSLGGRPVDTSPREWAVLLQLITNLGVPQSMSSLEDCVYGWEEEIESNAIRVHICNLRKKIGADIIRTVRGIGYVIQRI